MGEDYTEIGRRAWVHMEGRDIPYPFQNNIRGLQPQTVYECLRGLIEAQRRDHDPGDFQEWVLGVFGEGIAHHFMLPYNQKVWATPPSAMSFDWIAERVSVVDVDQILRNVLLGENQANWGPNATFRYPLHGGTGTLYERMAAPLEPYLRRSHPVVAIDPVTRRVTTAGGRRWRYDVLLSTMPLDDLVAIVDGAPAAVRRAAADLLSSGTHVVGVGIDRDDDSDRTWVYFPEADVPFYRVTYLSHYSPHVTPRPDQTLLLTETGTSPRRPQDAATIEARVVAGLRTVGMLRDDDRILAVWRCSPDKTYPVPSLGRDAALAVIQPWLNSLGIAARGRFGAWLYEIGNMDHSFMQGYQWADRILDGSPETVWIPR